MIKKRDIKIFAVSTVIGVAATFAQASIVSADGTSERIASEIIRFHVLANSDSSSDQELKMEIKTEVLLGLEGKLDGLSSIQQTRWVLENNLEYIKNIAKEVVYKNGYDFDVRVGIRHMDFPQTVYNNMTLPAGEYEALQIIVGEGTGQNWWCVMFPMLCFIDSAKGDATVEMQLFLSNILTSKEYEEIFDVRLRSVEWWRGRNDQIDGFYVFVN